MCYLTGLGAELLILKCRRKQYVGTFLLFFMTAFGTVLVWKAGWLRLDGIADKESLRLFLIVAVCGNLAGMAMTLTNGRQ